MTDLDFNGRSSHICYRSLALLTIAFLSSFFPPAHFSVQFTVHYLTMPYTGLCL